MNFVGKTVTPVALGRAKVRVDLPTPTYSHERQASLRPTGRIYMTTYNATQTFDIKGNPKDSDNDK